MNEINISSVIMLKRKEKGINQQELADYIGISKSAISKWETGQSCPDISFLPILASYFNISIDELINYTPQLNQNQINTIVEDLNTQFQNEKFDSAYEKLQTVLKQYYSCYPFVLQIVCIMMCYFDKANQSNQFTPDKIINHAIELCKYIKKESDDAEIVQNANGLHAACLLQMDQPEDVIELLEDENSNYEQRNSNVLSKAYAIMGNDYKAKEVLQLDIYESVLRIITLSADLLKLNNSDNIKSEEIIDKIDSLAKIFDIQKSLPQAMLGIILNSALHYSQHKNAKKTSYYLKRYVDLACNIEEPIKFSADSFFDSLEEVLGKVEHGNRIIKPIAKGEMMEGILRKQEFSWIKGTEYYREKSV